MRYRIHLELELNADARYMFAKWMDFPHRLTIGAHVGGLPQPIWGYDDRTDREYPGESGVQFVDVTPDGLAIAVLWPVEAHGVSRSVLLDRMLGAGWSLMDGGTGPKLRLFESGPMAPAVEAHRIPDHPQCGAGCDFCFEWALDH